MNFSNILSKSTAFQIKSPKELKKFLLDNLKASERTSSQLAIKYIQKNLSEDEDPKSDNFYRAQCMANYLEEMNNYKKMISMYRTVMNTSVTDQMRRMSHENFVNRLQKGSFKAIAHDIVEEKNKSGLVTESEEVYEKEMRQLKENLSLDLELKEKV